MVNPIYTEQNMVRRSYMLASLILSSCSLEYGVKRFLVDSNGNQGITTFWSTQCPDIWSINVEQGITTCFPKLLKNINCTVSSSSYNINVAKELYININTSTRVCANLNVSSCTGKFSLLGYFQISKKDFKRVTLPDELPKINSSFGTKSFYETDDDVSFSVEQNFKSVKLGFQAPFYCGTIKSVLLYYYVCPNKTKALVDFPVIPAPTKTLSPSIPVGTCTKNAVKKSKNHNLFMKCYYNGTAEVFGGCECEAGYTKKENTCEG